MTYSIVVGSGPRRGCPGRAHEDAQRGGDARRGAPRLREQAGPAELDDGRRGHREVGAPEHARPSVVHPVGLRHDGGWALRGPRLDVTDPLREEVTTCRPPGIRRTGAPPLECKACAWAVPVARAAGHPRDGPGRREARHPQTAEAHRWIARGVLYSAR